MRKWTRRVHFRMKCSYERSDIANEASEATNSPTLGGCSAIANLPTGQAGEASEMEMSSFLFPKQPAHPGWV